MDVRDPDLFIIFQVLAQFGNVHVHAPADSR
ncbi:hypothetical protein GGU45_003986 [Niabella hirudinis]